MGFMGGIFKVLGFEGEAKVKKRKNKTKATYKLKNEKNVRPNQIDGVPVYYPESLEQGQEFIGFVKKNSAIILSIEYCEKDVATRVIDYVSGFVYGANAKMIDLNNKQLFLLLPEGMEIEE